MPDKMNLWINSQPINMVYTEAGPANVLKACMTQWPWIKNYPRQAHELSNYYSEETVDRLANGGINFVMAGWSVGFSLAAEDIQRELVTKFTAACHRRNLKVGFYLSWCNMFWENMFHDEPHSKDWLRLEPDGSPAIVAFDGIKYPERYTVCVNNPGWWRYLKKKVALAVAAGADTIYFDNVGSSCYCRHCRKLFRKFAKKRFGRAFDMPNWSRGRIAGRKRLGPTSDLDVIAYCNLAAGIRVGASRALTARMLFDGERRRQRLKEMGSFIRTLRKDVPLSANVHEEPRASRVLDYFVSETARSPAWKQGAFRCNIALNKYMRALGNEGKTGLSLVRADQNPRIEKLAIAEGYAFGVPAGCHQMREFIHSDYSRFFLKHNELFLGARSSAVVAVVTGVYFFRCMNVRNNLAVQLARAHVPFDLLPEDDIFPRRLSGYKLIICPDLAGLSDRHITCLQGFVARGGTVILSGPFVRLDDKLRRTSPAMLHQAGTGHVFRHAKSLAVCDPYDLEKPAQPILKTVMQKIRGLNNCGFEMRAPDGIVGNLVFKRDGRSAALHIVNYAPKTAANIRVRIRRELLGFNPATARLLSPDGPAPLRLSCGMQAGVLHFAVPAVKIYSAIDIQ